jgi:hypothetical protein
MEASVKIATADAASGAEGVITDWLANVKNLILPVVSREELLVFQRTLTSEPPKNTACLGVGRTHCKWVEAQLSPREPGAS